MEFKIFRIFFFVFLFCCHGTGGQEASPVYPCCKAVDELVSAGNPGELIFYFEPSNSSVEDQLELAASVTKHLIPSNITSTDWLEIIEKNFLKTSGQEAESKIGSDPAASEQKDECPPKRKVWQKHTATCGNVTAVYYKGPLYTNDTDPICKNSRDNVCPDFCVASDEWFLFQTIKVAPKEDKEIDWEDRSKSAQNCPLLQYKPAIAKDDYTYVLIENSVKNQLSPSGKTGVNYKTYFENFYAEKTKLRHDYAGEDIPSEHVMHIYQARYQCGKHKADIREWKRVIFKVGHDAGNCELAKTNGVPLEGCKI